MVENGGKVCMAGRGGGGVYDREKKEAVWWRVEEGECMVGTEGGLYGGEWRGGD